MAKAEQHKKKVEAPAKVEAPKHVIGENLVKSEADYLKHSKFSKFKKGDVQP